MTRIHAATRSVSRLLRGEAVTLRDSAAVILVEISDAVVTLDPVNPGWASGPAERTGTLRLTSAHHAAAVGAHTCTVRGEEFDVLHVGKVHAGAFRVSIGKRDQDHPNLTDFNGTQAVWHQA
jgi:hypothetical protein